MDHLQEQHQEFMREAIRLSVKNVEEGIGGPFAAIVVREGEIISSGTNIVTTSNDPTAHAEIIAIRKACKLIDSFRLNGCIIYTTCEPCPMCLGAIYWARPAAVYYGNTQTDAAEIGFDDRFIYQELELPPKDRSIPQEQILQPEARQAFLLWKNSNNKKDY